MGNSAAKVNVVVCGLDNAGKTTMLYHMRLKEARRDFRSTTGFNYEVVPYIYKKQRFDLHMWDLAGEKRLRPLWSNFYNNMTVDALFFVLDAHDRTKLPEARAEFLHLVNETTLRETMFVVLANVKEGATEDKMKEGEIKEQLAFKSVPYVEPKIIEINAITGHGFASALDFVCRGPQY